MVRAYRKPVNSRRWPPLAQRFWQMVDKDGPVPKDQPDLGPCWIWTGYIGTNGYGRYGSRSAHRTAYELTYGVLIDKDKMACHKCDRPICVNPSHVFIGTAADNLGDCAKKNRITYGSKHPAAKLTEADVLNIREQVANGAVYSVIVEMYGISKTIVGKVVRGEIWARIGGARTSGRLTPEEVVEMRRLFKEGVGYSELAKTFDVCESSISRIVRYQTWADLP